MYLTVNLPEHILAIVEEQIASGRVESVSQYICGLIMQEKRNQQLHDVIMQQMMTDPEVQAVQAEGENIINDRQFVRWN